ncbi:hypothetical protein O181_087353 [Austropuccinia psidii MF-1]|uniref:Integrase catalytic domain-containing protein n=1 Tax=Austropuccinia psidii MF-1 TaxID=1389203 RepID=A0A9Q3P0Z9_9BASI|nr:hypothetical protein [Austropuccinia psidii MF-1]
MLEILPPSPQGFRYVLAIFDDFSHFNHIFLITEKSKAEGCVMSFINKVKNKLGITPGYIHTDHGDEFDSNAFQQLLLTRGISLEQGPPHSPQTNGVAECFNQSLLVNIQCLLAQSNIPISYWDEAELHASLLLNLLPHQDLQAIFFSNVMQLSNQPLNLVKSFPSVSRWWLKMRTLQVK